MITTFHCPALSQIWVDKQLLLFRDMLTLLGLFCVTFRCMSSKETNSQLGCGPWVSTDDWHNTLSRAVLVGRMAGRHKDRAKLSSGTLTCFRGWDVVT